MKTIRQGSFETNSSSTHSITMCMESEFEKWQNGELFFVRDEDRFVNAEEKTLILKQIIINNRAKYNAGKYTYKGITVDYSNKKELYTTENLDEITQKDIDEYLEENFDSYECPLTYDEYYESLEYATYEETFSTPDGQKVVAFGYYGMDN